MGLAKRHVVATKDRSCLTSTRSATILYEAPETETALGNKPRSRQFDIWSMGCIVTEWVIWVLYGNESLQMFYRELKGYSSDPEKWVPYYTLNETGSGELAAARPPEPERIRTQSSLSPDAAASSRRSNGTHMNTAGLQAPPTPSARLNDWQYPVDNVFAGKVASDVGAQSLAPRNLTPAKLCTRCAQLNFSNPALSFMEVYGELQKKQTSCQLCELLWRSWSQAAEDIQPDAVTSFEINQSNITMNGSQSMPVLSLLRDAETSHVFSGFQIGFPQLLESGTNSHFQILHLWLRNCDSYHQDCRLTRESSLPTRLIDVGPTGSPVLRLVETAGGIPGDTRYIALSHRWGDSKKHRPFCTRLKDNNGHDIESFKRSIPFQDVPQTFKDAFEATRRLGIRYLWIDSVCIVQGEGGDFSSEAKRMEDVFSSAYCVLAASRASNQRDGFLRNREREQRRFITIPQKHSTSIYVCEMMDDFGRHVLDGDLNRRGWVLQERALAQRTIYFTDAQTYFECGQGVRCETLAKMQNTMAEFLGDPNFPTKAMKENSRAMKIRYFQDLYRRYSRLEFTRIYDRPVAIAGLESRLRKAYWTKGGYGIFDDRPGHGLFHRSLLWHRGEEEKTLKPIDFSSSLLSAAPTWSWMAHEGGIDYLDPAFDNTEWEDTEIEPPWSVTGGGSDGSHDTSYLNVVVRSFGVAGYMADEVKFIYDNTQRKVSSLRNPEGPRCVVVARCKEGASVREKRHYVLVVAGTGNTTSRGQKIFSRLGVGYMPGKYIELGEDCLKGVVR
ncbi:heterokaryon incompatibility protein-domain-containing protein [Colletotrichum cereale]|nr:heterokaryon incompatibility protein-domain-containing protein [Colletotrichum cereale]